MQAATVFESFRRRKNGLRHLILNIPMEDDDQLGMMILSYMLQQKLLGREKILESEISESLGLPWDPNLEDRWLLLTDLGENALGLYEHKKKGLR